MIADVFAKFGGPHRHRMPEEAKSAARARVAALVQQFNRNEADYLGVGYNETQARTDFITPLLAAFGWDVNNARGYPLGLREVIEEATVEVGPEKLSKRPDYELRLARQRKLFVEAKKPSVHIDRDRLAAFQARRYGYSASLPISVLTNFHQLAIYDCRPIPSETDEAHVARLDIFSYEDFEARFDELWSVLSRESVYSGDFDRRFEIGATRRGAQQFDDLFLDQVRQWRERLAVDIQANTPGLTPSELTYAVQLFLSRIVFLRICEDREIEKYETLKSIGVGASFGAFMELLRRADEFYDSGLFRLIDDAPLNIRISDATLQRIISELYYPHSPYTFAVVETEVLGEIYEQFLGEEIVVRAGGVEILPKPEVRESGGVVPTPRYIADAIVARTLAPAIRGKSPEELAQFTVADICLGSGMFLLSAFELLLDHYLDWYVRNDRANNVGRTIYEAAANQWRLTFDEKRRVLLRHIRGVDIDSNAVEVARLNLLLKLIEGETAADLRDFVERNVTAALPSLNSTIRVGNSLVSQREWVVACGRFPPELMRSVNPFTWSDEFHEVMEGGGFDVIIGNPPYIRIQNMQHYSPEEADYYHSQGSPFFTAHQDNFDKYLLFIERALGLVRPTGRVGMIVPHKFMTIRSGERLRGLLTNYLEQVVHFGVQQVFGPDISNYTCLLIGTRSGCDEVLIEQVRSLSRWRYGEPGDLTRIPSAHLGAEAWEFAEADTRALFERIRHTTPNKLANVADIFVGVQTSADDIYILHPKAEDANTVTVEWEGTDWHVERGVLRPCLHDVPLPAYSRPRANSWIIFPYELRANPRGKIVAHLMQPDVFRVRFPLCWEYLSARQEELDDRDVTGGLAAERQWYQYGRSQSLTKFGAPKIILPILSLAARYAYDDDDIVVTGGGNGPYYMVRSRAGLGVSDLYLLAVLNHPLAEAFVRKYTSAFRGGYYSHGKQFIAEIPVPVPADAQRMAVEDLVRRLLNALGRVARARLPHERVLHEREVAHLLTEVEAAVSRVYGLTNAEVAVARSVPIPG